jgi:hypothetical protein
MDERDKQLTSIVNASGFLFQLRVAQLVSSTFRRHGWRVLVEEHPWKDVDTRDEGFIDMAMARDSIRLVVECKKVNEGAWVFLVPEAESSETGNARALMTWNSTTGKKTSNWEDIGINPLSFEAAFCMVRGGGEGERPLLERLASYTTRATESFAAQELTIDPAPSLDIPTLYIPVIVTNADLIVCSVAPEKVDLSTGRIQPDDAKYASVQAIRFRKALTTRLRLSDYEDIHALNQDAERTVFVVNISTLPEWLRGISLFDQVTRRVWGR